MDFSRIYHLFFLVAFLFVILLGRLVQIQLVEGDVYRSKARARKTRLDFTSARRGKILDRHGRILAHDQGVFHLAVIPEEIDPSLCLYLLLGGKEEVLHLQREVERNSSSLSYPLQLSKISPYKASRILKVQKENPQKLPGLTIDWEEEKIFLLLKAPFFSRRRETFSRLSEITGLSPQKLVAKWKKILRRLEGAENFFERRALSRSHQKILSQLSPEVMHRLEIADLPGVYITTSSRRVYPHRRSTWHILGFLGAINRREYKELRKEKRVLNFARYGVEKLSELGNLLDEGYFMDEKIGKRGLEKVYESHLRGRKGARLLMRDYKNRSRGVLEEIPPQAGRDLKLTLDLKLQKALVHGFDKLEKDLQAGRADQKTLRGHISGAGVAINPRNGEVLALVSYPLIDTPHRKMAPFFFRTIAGRYPPGSIFKPLTAMAFLEAKTSLRRGRKARPWSVTPHSQVFCRSRFKNSRYFKCLGYHGDTDVVRALQKSCNIYFYHYGEKLGGKRLAQWTSRFGLNEKTGLELEGEKKGVVPSPSWKREHISQDTRWWPGDSRNFAIGQGYLTVTPVGIARALATVFNGGEVLDLHLVEKKAKKVRRKLHFSPQNKRAVYRGMRKVIDRGGTAYHSGLNQFLVAAKTGSAQDGQGFNFAWIAGVCWGRARSRDVSIQERRWRQLWRKTPQVAFVIVVEHTTGHGGDTAGPLATRLLEAHFPARD